jgi:hypothetical protein
LHHFRFVKWERLKPHSGGRSNNNNTFTWSGPSGVLGCTGQRRKRHYTGECSQTP